MCFAKKNLITQFSSSSWSANSRKNPLRNRCSSEWTPPRKRTKRNCSRMLQATLHLQDECHLEYPCHTASGSKTWNQILSIYKEKKKKCSGNANCVKLYIHRTFQRQRTPRNAIRRKAEKGEQEAPYPETERTFSLLLKSFIYQSSSL